MHCNNRRQNRVGWPTVLLLSLVTTTLSGCGGGASGPTSSGVNSFDVSGISDNSVGSTGGIVNGTGVGSTSAPQIKFITPPPSSVTALTGFTVQVALEDAAGNIDPNQTDAITLSFAAPAPKATFQIGTGTAANVTVNAVAGIATFSGVSINASGTPTTKLADGVGTGDVTLLLASTANIAAGNVLQAGSTVTTTSTDTGGAGLNLKTGTTINVSSTTGMAAGNVLLIGTGTANPEELLIVAVKSSTQLTVTRAFNATTALAWPSGTMVQTLPEQILVGAVSGNEVTGCTRGFNGTVPFAWPTGTAIGVEEVVASLVASDAVTGESSTVLTAATANFTINQPLQFTYVATNTGLNVFTLAANGTVTPVPADNIALTGVQGLAVAPSGSFLVAAINSGTNSTSGLQVYAINPLSGALTAKTLVAVGSANGPVNLPAGPIALDPNGALGVYDDVTAAGGDLEGFTVNASGAITVNTVLAVTDTVNSLSIAQVGTQDVVVQGSEAGNGAASATLSSGGALAAGTNLGTAAGNPGHVAIQGAVATQGGTGLYLTSNNTSSVNTNNSQTFTLAAAGTLTSSGQSQLQPNGTADAGAFFNSANIFFLGGASVVECTTAAALGSSGDQQSVFLVPFATLANGKTTEVATATTIQQPVTGTPVASGVAFPPVANSTSGTVLVISNNQGTLTLSPFIATASTNLVPGTPATVAATLPAAGANVTAGTASTNPNIVGTASFFF